VEEAELATPRADASEKTEETEIRLLASDSEIELRGLRIGVVAGPSNWPWEVESCVVESLLLLGKLP